MNGPVLRILEAPREFSCYEQTVTRLRSPRKRRDQAIPVENKGESMQAGLLNQLRQERQLLRNCQAGRNGKNDCRRTGSERVCASNNTVQGEKKRTRTNCHWNFNVKGPDYDEECVRMV